jgi:hypothetical protein
MSLHDALVAPLWLAVNGFLVRSMWRVAARLFPDHSFYELLLDTIVLCWASIVSIAILLGLMGGLSAPTLLTAVATLGLLAPRLCRCPRAHPFVISQPPGEGLGPGEGAAVYATPNDDGTTAPSKISRRSSLESWCWLGWGLWAALAAGRLAVSGLGEYPTDWDSLTYHLPLVDQWLATGNLYVPGVVKWFFPGNSELLALWMVAPFSGDFFAPLNNFPSIILLVLSAIHLGHILGLGTLLSHLAAFGMVSNYIVRHQLITNKNDVAAASLFLACLVYGLRHAFDSRNTNLVMAAICLGLCAGVKYYALLYACLALLILLVCVWSLRGSHLAFRAATVYFSGLLLLGAYWYARNFWLTGTPVYPKAFTAAGTIQTGAHPELWTTCLLGNNNPERWSLWFSALWRMTGPSHLAAVIFLPLSLAYLFVSGLSFRRGPSAKRAGNVRWALLSLTVGAGALYATTPFTIETSPGTLGMVKIGYVTIRLGFTFFTLALLANLILVSDAIRWTAAKAMRQARDSQNTANPVSGPASSNLLSTLIVSVVIGLVVAQALWNHRLPAVQIARKWSHQFLPSLLIAEGILLVGATIALVWQAYPRSRPIQILGLSLTALGLATTGISVLAQRWHTGFAEHYNQMFGTRIFSYLEGANPASMRLCVALPRSYPFAGSRRQFYVVQAFPIAAQPRRFRSPKAFLKYLQQHDTTMITSTSRPVFWPVESAGQWWDSHPGLLSTIWSDRTFILDRLHQQMLAQIVNDVEEDP